MEQTNRKRRRCPQPGADRQIAMQMQLNPFGNVKKAQRFPHGWVGKGI
jgi:hypothetical protein